MQNHRNGVLSIFLISSTRTIGPKKSPDLNPLAYNIWDKLAHHVKWNGVKYKTTFGELKCVVHKVSPDVVFESCPSWTNRLSQGNGSYLK